MAQFNDTQPRASSTSVIVRFGKKEEIVEGVATFGKPLCYATLHTPRHLTA